ncbi:hypothetical protein PIB30_043781 [Stylosanthes scabra]|uniref:Uncharacterized protein n=1 Tax=Stylosanthes scabra TaxID=79078 RepID=A0ABU6RG59_9FABA|nr:hypothetical protein [Stylosanthes scabra]
MAAPSIRHLPENVRSSVRSGIFLFDSTRVVEELVFNSLDAAATKEVELLEMDLNWWEKDTQHQNSKIWMT